MGAEDRSSARRSGVKEGVTVMVNTINETEPLICLCPFGTVPRPFGCHSEGRVKGGDSHMNCHYLVGYVAQGAYSRWRVKNGLWRSYWEETTRAPWMTLLYYLNRGREGLV